MLYTLYATPSVKEDFVMVAALDTIKSYLGVKAEVAATMLAGAERGGASVNIRDWKDGRVGYWRVVKGARLPLGTMVSEA